MAISLLARKRGNNNGNCMMFPDGSKLKKLTTTDKKQIQAFIT